MFAESILVHRADKLGLGKLSDWNCSHIHDVDAFSMEGNLCLLNWIAG